jgi:hypothetical protein
MTTIPALSLAHFREFMEQAIGLMQKLVEGLAQEPERLAALRVQFEALAAPYYVNNAVQQTYILTRARLR